MYAVDSSYIETSIIIMDQVNRGRRFEKESCMVGDNYDRYRAGITTVGSNAPGDDILQRQNGPVNAQLVLSTRVEFGEN